MRASVMEGACGPCMFMMLAAVAASSRGSPAVVRKPKSRTANGRACASTRMFAGTRSPWMTVSGPAASVSSRSIRPAWRKSKSGRPSRMIGPNRATRRRSKFIRAAGKCLLLPTSEGRHPRPRHRCPPPPRDARRAAKASVTTHTRHRCHARVAGLGLALDHGDHSRR